MKRIVATIAVLLIAGTVSAQTGTRPTLTAAQRWHALHTLAMLKGDVNPVGGVPVAGGGGGGGGASITGTNVWTGSNTFTDSLFKVCDDGDPTKCVVFQTSGVTTGNSALLTITGGSASAGFTVGGNITSTTGQLLVNSSWNISNNGDLVGFGGSAPAKLGFASVAASVGLSATATSFFTGDNVVATIQMGADINGAAVNQTLKAGDGITGTDILGSGLTFAAGRGTGAGASNPLVLSRQITKPTGTTAQTYAPAVIVCPHKILSTTSAVTTTIATITTTTTSAGTVTMDYGNTACSASTCDQDSGIVKVSWNNNAGTVAAAMTAVAVQSDSDATGTLAATPTQTVATNVVSIKLTPTWVTIVPTSVFATYTFTVHSAADTVVCQ